MRTIAKFIFIFALSLTKVCLAENLFSIRLTAMPGTLDWNKASTNFESLVLLNIMEGLTEIDQSLQVKPALCTKWDVSEEGKLYTFTIRPNIKWSDGSQLTANDFVESWNKLTSATQNSAYKNYLDIVETY